MSSDTYYPCQEGSDCCKDDYCRCGEITSTRVVSPPDFKDVVAKVAKHFALKANSNDNELDLYACDRILTFLKAYETDFYYVRVGGGYYGQEVEGVYFNYSEKLAGLFDRYFKLENDTKSTYFKISRLIFYGADLSRRWLSWFQA